MSKLIKSKRVTESFDDLVKGVRKWEFTRDIHDEQEGQILRALSWIQYQQNSDGTWGLGTMIDTVLALQATGIWSPDKRTWNIKNGAEGGVDLAFKWLDSFQVNRCWDNNLWDTSAVIRAACLLGEQRRQSVQDAVEWLIDRSRDRWNLDEQLGFHYISQALIALVFVDAPQDVINQCRSNLIEAIRLTPIDNFRSPYIFGQVLEALIICGANPADQLLTPIIDYLKEYLTVVDVSISNFMHICASFKGLGEALGGSPLNEPAMQLTLGKMFHPTRIRDDGSWYRDITMTGWALVALRNLKKVRKIEVYPYQIYTMIENTQREIEDFVSDRLEIRKRLLINSILSTLFTILLVALIITNIFYQFSFFGNVEFFYFIIGLLVSFIIYFSRKIIVEFR